MATYTDDFNRANATISTAVVGAGCQIVSNEFNGGGSGLTVSALIGEDFDDDQYAEVEIVAFTSFDEPGAAIRFNGSGDGYVVATNSSEIRCYEVTAGSATQIGYTTTTVSVNDTIGLGIVGTTLTAYLNGSPETWAESWDGVDSTHSSGVAGVAYFYGNDNLSRGDNFLATGWNGGGETLAIDDAGITHGQTITFTSSIADATSAKAIDSDTNEIALTSFTDLGANGSDRDYSAVLPALSDGYTGLLPDATWTIEITNGSDTATDTVTTDPLPGHNEIVVGTPDGSLTVDDWAYGLSTAIATGDIAWWPTTAGVTFNDDGTVTIDTDVFESGVITGWAQDITDRRWTRIVKTYEAEAGGISGSGRIESAAVSSESIGAEEIASTAI